MQKQSLREQQIAYLQKSVDYTKELLKYSSATNYTDVLTSEQSLLAASMINCRSLMQWLIYTKVWEVDGNKSTLIKLIHMDAYEQYLEIKFS